MKTYNLTIMGIMLLLFPLATMFKSGNIFAADPPKSEYEAAMSAIEDGKYYLVTEVGETKWYLTQDGYLTDDMEKAYLYDVSKESGGDLYNIGILLEPNNGAHYSNTTLDGNKANLHPFVASEAHYRQDDYGNNRKNWERQVFFLNAEAGKFAIRSCNTQYVESGYEDAGRAFWTYEVIETDEGLLVPTPCYSYEPAYVWMLVSFSSTLPVREQVANIFQGCIDSYSAQYNGTAAINIGTGPGQYSDEETWLKFKALLNNIAELIENLQNPDYDYDSDPNACTIEQAKALRADADSMWKKFLDSEILPEGISFADINVKAICLSKWDTNGDRVLSYDEAAAVTEIGSVFESNQEITSFDELRYFTGLKNIHSYAFCGCRSLTSITIPNSVTSIDYNAFSGCTSLSKVEYSSIESMCGISFAFYTSNPWYVGAANLYIDGEEMTGKIVIPEGVTSISKYAFCCESSYEKEYPITSIVIPSTVTEIGDAAFTVLDAAVCCYATIPPILGSRSFSGRILTLFVPRESIDAYKNANGWKDMAHIYSIDDMSGIHNLNISHPVYYDYDGDGVMEMFAFYKGNKEEYGKQFFGLMDDDRVIKKISGPENNINVIKSMICDSRVPKIANGDEDINIGNFIIRNDGSAEDIFKRMISSKYSDYGRLLFMDYDNDGHLDAANKSTVLVQQNNGSFLKTALPTIQDSTYIAYFRSTAKIYSPLSMEGWYVSGVSSDIEGSGYSLAIDLNGDGWLDMLTEDGKSAYMSLGDNYYCQIAFNGSIFPYDLNGDGILDYVLYDGNDIYTVLYDTKGQTSQKKIFSNTSVKKFVCRDFDHDDDVDVLAFIMDETNTYFVFLRNDGNGSFKKKESYLEGGHSFIECKDYDADGLYEVLLSTLWKEGYYDTLHGQNLPPNKIIKIGKDFSLKDVSESLVGNSEMMLMNLGDYNNDGYTEYKMVNGTVHVRSGSSMYNYHEVSIDGPHYTGLYSKQNVPNTAPLKMPKPSVMLDESTGFLRIIWERGQDAETSACDLTYEVRIGSEPGKGDVLYAPSLADGRRRVVADGAMGTQLQTLFNIAKHPEGTYYVAVQAIDAGGLGGAWSDETVYNNVFSAPNILAENTLTTTMDTITVVADGFNDNNFYQWSVTNGDVVSQEGNRAQVSFHNAGAQYVRLTTIHKGVNYQSNELKIDVKPFKEKESEYWYVMLDKSLDLNQDGYPDGFTGSNYFLVNDSKGNLTKYPKSFNSDLSISDPHVLDLNRDGFPDILCWKSNKGNVFINDEEGDFEIEQRNFYFTYSEGVERVDNYYITYDFLRDVDECIDFTNTGICDILTNMERKSRIIRTNDYSTLNFVSELGYLNDYKIIDINRDGFFDIVYRTNRDYTYYYKALINNGDGTFNEVLLLEIDTGTTWNIADINNDGYIDLITGGYYSNGMGGTVISYQPLNIYFGKADNTYSLDLSLESNLGIGDIQDYDNNGFMDIPIFHSQSKSKSEYYTIFFDRDMQYHMVEGDCSSAPFIIMDGNGYPQGRRKWCMSTIKNEKPKAPSTISIRQTEEGMVINWSDAEDDHTPGVQMRYNVSVKRKGKTGPDSYLISPMNGGDGNAALVFPWYYKQSTTMTVPNSALTAGETYEVQVQAIDLWNQWSPMTEPVEITISADGGMIDVPDLACVGRETTIKYTGVLNDVSSIDFGTDSQYTRDGNNFIVTWSSEGLKEIAIGKHNSQVLVMQPIDVSFTIPSEVFVGASLPVSLSKEMIDMGSKGNLSFVSCPKGARTSVNYSPTEGKAWLTFDKPGYYEVEANCIDEVRGNSMRLSFEAQNAPVTEIKSVDVSDGHYTVGWNTADLPNSVNKVIIYKEGNRLNQFNVLDTVDVSIGQYVDRTSSSSVMSERYKIGLLSEGGQLFESKPHKPLHVMITTSVSGGYNILWNAYEGLTVDNYRIWRGTSPDNLVLLAQMAGSQQSFTDSNAPSDEIYYAVSFSPVNRASVKSIRRASYAGGDVCSNVVSTRSASSMVLANSLSIVTLIENPSLTEDNRTLQLYSILLPTYCTYNKVAWSIVEGEELADISSNGLLTAKEGRGNVRVRVSTLDGSDLTDEITVYVNVPEYIDPDVLDSVDGTTSSYGVSEIARYDLNGRKLSAPQRGINIIRMSDGTTRKVQVK
ncbi:MAG: leucine-rich repeat protein [Bacteroidaceae bacterium]|nr:leucine-rich repeat protein [Bacteroidaceae bacterium]